MTRYMILRGGPALVRGGRSATSPSAAPDLSVENLSPKDVKDIGSDPRVKGLAPVMPTRLVVPSKPLVSSGQQDGGGDAWGIAAIGADRSCLSGAGVAVAVLDTGIDARHPAFEGIDLVRRDFTGTGDDDVNGHGTHCAGIFFGQDVDGRRIGVARGVKRAMIAKVLNDDGRGDSDMIVSALLWALGERVQVASMSVGFDFPQMVADMCADGWPIQLATAVALRTFQANVRVFDTTIAMFEAHSELGPAPFVVAAAGNESRRDDSSDYRIGTSLPAAAKGVLSVGAVARNGALCSIAAFSNAWPTITAPGVGILSARSHLRAPEPAEVPGTLEVMSGTSMACPHVAGVAAMWVEKLGAQDARLDPRTVMSQITVGATKAVFTEGHDEADIGDGLAQAP